MNNKNILYLLLVASIMTIWGCEKINDDELPPSTTNTSSGITGREVYTFQNSDIAIDPSQFITVLDVKSFSLASTPKYGTANFLADGVLLYTPHENIVEAEEDLIIELKRGNGVSYNQTLNIEIVPNSAQLPCLNAAMGDKAKTEINKEILIDVLENDQICEGTFKEIMLLPKPINGVATIVDNKIKYLPKSGFKGADKIVYAFTIENNGKIIKRPGVVNIEVFDSNDINGGGVTCKTMLRNDLVEFFPTKDSILINVISNDKFCADDLQKGKLSILKQTVNGKVDFLSNKLLSYKPKPNIGTSPPMGDSLTYKFINSLGETFTAKVLILPKKMNPNCHILAFGDDFEFILKNLVGKTFIDLDVLKNDLTCGKVIKTINIIPAKPELSVVNNKIRYTPVEFKKGVVYFQYEITDDSGEKSKSGYVKIKFVD